MILTRTQVERIKTHTVTDFPNECCGLLFGRLGVIEYAIPMRNVHATPDHAYAMDPREELRTFLEMDRRDFSVIGIYHSHPRSDPYPSARDREDAKEIVEKLPAVRFLIVGPNYEMRAYQIAGDTIVEEPVVVLEEARVKA